MITLDMPDVPQHYASVMVAQANQAAVSKERAMGICFAVDHGAMLSPEGVAQEYFGYYENNKAVALPSPGDAELIVQPKHGKVDYVKMQDGLLHARYLADAGYIGDDKFDFKVKVDGKIVRVHYLLKVTDKGADNGEVQDLLCKKTGNHWKISATTPALDNASLQALLGAANINSNVSVTFSDLTGGALGQATGTSITLDDNAAGHNWFIDTTPGSNEEFLPTSNPYEWVAKEGTAAYGKMDMLSVLLHEYGHALGIDHSADGHDYMATTLTAGVRRLPSAEELALMQQLVGEVKVEMANVSTLGSGTTPSQLPLLPLGGFQAGVTSRGQVYTQAGVIYTSRGPSRGQV